MRTNLLPGAAAKLRSLGINPNRLGVIVNKLATAADTDVDRLPVPRNGDELAEMFGDDQRLKPVMASKEALMKFIGRYATQQQAPGTDLYNQVEGMAQQALARLLKDGGQDGSKDSVQRLNLSPQTGRASMLTTHKQATAYNARAAGAVLDGKFASGMEYIENIWHLNTSDSAVSKRNELRNAFGSVTPADGGFLVPETLRSQLLQIALEMALVRPRATVVPMETARVPFPMIDSTSNASSVFGGMIAYWTEEGGALVDSSAKFGRVVLDAKKLTGLSAVPNELLADSLISFAALIERLWPEAIAWYEDAAFVSGTGVGEPLGFLGGGNPAGIGVDKENLQSADTIVLQNIIKMYSRMLPSSLNRGIWVCSPECLPELFTMALSVGTGGAPVMLSNVAGAAPMTIFGRPLLVNEKMGRLGDRGDIAFIDLSYYLVGDRQSMQASSSTDYKFGEDKTTFRIIQRVDGRPWIQSAVAPKYGGPSLSPFVELAERA